MFEITINDITRSFRKDGTTYSYSYPNKKDLTK